MLSNVIVTGTRALACPICGSYGWDSRDIFARCRRCGSEVTILDITGGGDR